MIIRNERPDFASPQETDVNDIVPFEGGSVLDGLREFSCSVRKRHGKSSEYRFSDPNAQAYYDALTAANGGVEIDTTTLYGNSNDDFKGIIDNLALDAKSSSVWDRWVRPYLFLGGTSATHAINFKNAATELTFIGSPTHGSDGVTLNGLTQYIDMNNVPHNDGAPLDFHLSQLMNLTGTTWGAGARDNSGTGIFTRYTGVDIQNQICGINLPLTPPGSPSSFFISTVTSSTNRKAYENGGVLAFSVGLSAADNAKIFSTKLGAWDNFGTILNHGQGDMKFGSVGFGVSDAEALSMSNLVNNLQVALGR